MKKFICLFLSLLILLTSFSTPVFAGPPEQEHTDSVLAESPEQEHIDSVFAEPPEQEHTDSVLAEPPEQEQMDYEKLTILSPSQTDYKLGFYYNQFAIGNSVLVPVKYTPDGKYVDKASLEFIILETMYLMPRNESDVYIFDDVLEMTDLEITLNDILLTRKLLGKPQKHPTYFTEITRELILVHDDDLNVIVVDRLSIEILGVKTGDIIYISIPEGAIYIPDTNIVNTAVEFTFYALTKEESIKQYPLYYFHGERYPDIPPSVIINPTDPIVEMDSPDDQADITNATDTQDEIIDRPDKSWFPDVPETHWAYTYIKALVERDVLSGYPDGLFKPDAQVTRSEFATMMVRALEIPLVTGEKPSFADVAYDAWDYGYVETIKDFMDGYKLNGEYFFKGNEMAVREDIVAALIKSFDFEIEIYSNIDEHLALFINDYADITKELKSYVLIALEDEIIFGYPDGSFGAQRTITRAEAVTMLYRTMLYL